MSDNQGKVFKTRVTPKAAMYGAIPLTSALVLAHFAVDAANKFHPNDPVRVFFVGIPAVLSIVIILSLAIAAKHFLNRTIGVRGNELRYTDGKNRLNLGIAEMAFSPPSHKAMLKTIMFSDGVSFIQIPEIFLGAEQFNELLQLILKRRQVEDLSAQKTWTL